VNALLADGEISKAEVERTKEKIAVAKAKPKQERSKVAQVADAPEKPRQKVVASTDIKPILKQEQRLASKIGPIIDQRTYEALISRVHFLADPEVVESSRVVQSFEPKGATVRDSVPTEPLAYRKPAGPSIDTVDLEPKPPVTAKTAAEPNKSRLPPAEKPQAAEGSKQARGSIITSAGKMSLGKNPSPDQANKPEQSNSQAWDDYMQSRFNGGMNYEGLGARFSKGP
jgi:hypothetical protein